MSIIASDDQPPGRRSSSVTQWCADEVAHLVDPADLLVAQLTLGKALLQNDDVGFITFWEALSQEMQIVLWTGWDSKQRNQVIKPWLDLWKDAHG